MSWAAAETPAPASPAAPGPASRAAPLQPLGASRAQDAGQPRTSKNVVLFAPHHLTFCSLGNDWLRGSGFLPLPVLACCSLGFFSFSPFLSLLFWVAAVLQHSQEPEAEKRRRPIKRRGAVCVFVCVFEGGALFFFFLPWEAAAGSSWRDCFCSQVSALGTRFLASAPRPALGCF